MRRAICSATVFSMLTLCWSVPGFAEESEATEPVAAEAEVVADTDTATEEAENVLEEEAATILEAMGMTLSSAQHITVLAEVISDEWLDDGKTVHLSGKRTVKITRPDALYAESRGEIRNRNSWFDGKTLTVYDLDEHAFAVFEVGGSIEEMFDHVYETTGMVQPLADLFYRDVGEELLANIDSGRYVGEEIILGVTCHHLAFRQETVDWQIWIDTGDTPFPRRLVITYKLEEGRPQFIADFTGWDLKTEHQKQLFSFIQPDGAEEVDLEVLAETWQEIEE